METLTVWKFPDAAAAQKTERTLKDLQAQRLIKIHDAAVVSWAEGAKRPKTKQLVNLAGVGALNGVFWGMLFGLLFFVPLLGAAIGAAVGAITGSLADFGIDDNFIKSVQEEITPGTSALFLLSTDAVIERVREAFPTGAELIRTNLSDEQERSLREAFE